MQIMVEMHLKAHPSQNPIAKIPFIGHNIMLVTSLSG
jgi:hypothetical protein